MIAAELTAGGLARRFTLRLPPGASGQIPLAAGPTGAGSPRPTKLVFDAAEEICRFARPLLTPAATRRLP